MGEKKNKKEGEKKQNDGGKKDDGSTTVVLRTDVHCEGCATKIKKYIRSFEGVETINRDEKDPNKITVTGKVDPEKIREKLEQKTKKKVELVSPLPKKDNNKDKDKDGQKKPDEKPEKKPDEKKSKEPPLTTAMLKLNLHCEGCIQKIHKIVTRTKGYQEMSVDRAKDMVTVKGTMDAKALSEALKAKLRRPVEIVQPAKKEKEGGGGGGGEKKEKGGGGGGGGGEKKEKGGDGGQEKPAVGGGESGGYVVDGNRMEYMPQYGYPYPYVYGPGQEVQHVHAPQIFSDENPNACSIM